MPRRTLLYFVISAASCIALGVVTFFVLQTYVVQPSIDEDLDEVIGKTEGLLQATYSGVDLYSIISNVAISGGGYIFTVGERDKIISYHPNHEEEGKVLSTPITRRGALKLGDTLFRYRAIRVSGQVLIAVMPLARSANAVFVAVAVMVLGGIIILLVMSRCVITYWGRYIGKELSSVTSTIKAIASGEFGVGAVDAAAPELTELCEHVRTLIESVKDVATESENVKVCAEHTSEAKSAFLANMSHEIRTPLNGIIGFTELALDPDVSLSAKNTYLKQIKTGGIGLLEIINNILDISKIEAGKMELESISFNLDAVIKACCDLVRSKAESKGVAFHCNTEPVVKKMLIGDPTKLKQVLLNLLSNAVKFTDTGAVKLLVEVVECTDNDIEIRFEVRDSGVGIAKEALESVFAPFSQADNSTTRRFGGTGLGLSIAKQLVEQMGGEMTGESVAGIGSRFSFVLSFGLTEVAVEDKIKDDDSVPEKPRFRGEVLLCEDNEMNQNVICDHLAQIGLKCVIASNGEEGINAYRIRSESGKDMFDLILMDINMPVMDGMEAASLLRDSGCTVPIIAVTANVITGDKTMYENNGFSDVLSKPFRSHELWACLDRYLKRQEVRVLTVRKEDLFGNNSVAVEDEKPAIVDDKKQKLLDDFAKSNKNTWREFATAMVNKDFKTAHRVVHTLKGLAALIEEPVLRDAALQVEKGLQTSRVECTPLQVELMKSELERVLHKIETM